MGIFLVGLLLFSSVFLRSGNYLGPYTYYNATPITQGATLTEETPALWFNSSYMTAKIVITGLSTNNTPVTLVVGESAQVLYKATNITGMTGFSVDVQIGGAVENWVGVIRQESDAEVTVQIVRYFIYYYTPPPAAPPPYINLLVFVGPILCVFAVIRMMQLTSKFEYPQNSGTKIFAVILLCLIGVSSCFSLLNGQVKGDFIPVSTTVILPSDNYSLTINTTNPSALLNMSEFYPEDAIGTSYRIYSLVSDHYPILVTISNGTISELVLESESKYNPWSFTIPRSSSSSIYINIERGSIDTKIALAIERRYQVPLPKMDITFPAIEFALGISMIVIGFVIVFKIDRHSE